MWIVNPNWFSLILGYLWCLEKTQQISKAFKYYGTNRC
jgi:uncharacterized protein YqhQ